MNITNNMKTWETILLLLPLFLLISWCWLLFIDSQCMRLPLDYWLLWLYSMGSELYAKLWSLLNIQKATIGNFQEYIVLWCLMERQMISSIVVMLVSVSFNILNSVLLDGKKWVIIHFVVCVFNFIWCGLFKLIIL